MRLQPVGAELFLHQRHVVERVLGVGDAAGGLVADLDAGFLSEPADHADHGQRGHEVGIDLFLAGRGLDEIGACQHADQ
ncbi:hypothetical protein D3C72_2187790 [compost metagenome]